MLDKKQVIDFLSSHKSELEKQFGIINLFLYGSFAIDKANEHSDIDILLEVTKEQKKWANFLMLKEFLSSQLHREIDIAYADSLNPVIKKAILKELIKI